MSSVGVLAARLNSEPSGPPSVRLSTTLAALSTVNESFRSGMKPGSSATASTPSRTAAHCHLDNVVRGLGEVDFKRCVGFQVQVPPTVSVSPRIASPASPTRR